MNVITQLTLRFFNNKLKIFSTTNSEGVISEVAELKYNDSFLLAIKDTMENYVKEENGIITSQNYIEDCINFQIFNDKDELILSTNQELAVKSYLKALIKDKIDIVDYNVFKNAELQVKTLLLQ